MTFLYNTDDGGGGGVSNPLVNKSIHVWRMDEASGSTFNDSENTADGALEGGAGWNETADSWEGGAATSYQEFNTEYGIVDANRQDPSSAGALAITVHATTFPATSNDTNYAFAHPGTTDDNRLYIQHVENDGNLVVALGNNNETLVLESNAAVDTTYRVGIAWDEGADEMEGYLNGASQGTTTINTTGGLNLLAENWFFASFDGEQYGYEGYLDYAIMCDERPTDQDFQDDYNAQPWS